jgi:hypothetical protein
MKAPVTPFRRAGFPIKAPVAPFRRADPPIKALHWTASRLLRQSSRPSVFLLAPAQAKRRRKIRFRSETGCYRSPCPPPRRAFTGASASLQRPRLSLPVSLWRRQADGRGQERTKTCNERTTKCARTHLLLHRFEHSASCRLAGTSCNYTPYVRVFAVQFSRRRLLYFVRLRPPTASHVGETESPPGALPRAGFRRRLPHGRSSPGSADERAGRRRIPPPRVFSLTRLSARPRMRPVPRPRL